MAQKFSGKLGGNLGKNPSHPHNMRAPTPMLQFVY